MKLSNGERAGLRSVMTLEEQEEWLSVSPTGLVVTDFEWLFSQVKAGRLLPRWDQ